MNFKNGGVQIWQNVCIAARALHSDTMFPTPTAKPAEPGSLISERSAPLSTESTRQFRSVPVAFARARSKEAENASRRKNIRKPLHIEGAFFTVRRIYFIQTISQAVDVALRSDSTVKT